MYIVLIAEGKDLPTMLEETPQKTKLICVVHPHITIHNNIIENVKEYVCLRIRITLGKDNQILEVNKIRRKKCPEK